jgi:enoyl-CoA hydratase
MSDALVEARDGILIITINRPDAKNAMNKEASELIAAALDRLDAENDLRVGIVTGAGGTFCSGMDLKGFLRGETPFVAGRGFGGITQKSPAKPLIAAVDGYALAGGLEVAIACDMIVANENAKFGIPEVKRGLGRCCRRPDAPAQENSAAHRDGTGADRRFCRCQARL